MNCSRPTARDWPLVPAITAVFLQLGASASAQTRFRPVTHAARTGIPDRSAVIADLNADGAPDIVPAGSLPYSFWLHLNSGMGDFDLVLPAMPTAWRLNWIGSGGPGVVDVDGDSDLDLLVYMHPTPLNPGASPFVACLLNDGRAVFTVQQPVIDRFGGAAISDVGFLHAGDLDGDGRSDLVVPSGPYTTSIRIFRNIGQGQFRESQGAVPPHVGPYYIAHSQLLDVDGDGDLDFAAATHGSAIPPLLLINDGTGRFVDGFPFVGIEAEEFAAGDLNGDGHLDFLFGATDPATLRAELWMSDGYGGYFREGWRLPSLWSTAGRYGPAPLADLDGDSDLDIAIRDIPYVRFLLNDGTANFTDGAAALGITQLQAWIWLGDIDRDGDHDVLTASSQPVPTFFNTHRQIAANNPSVGGTLDIDLYSQPNHLVTYLLGLARSDILLPGIGWFGLDPPSAVAWPGLGSIGAGGVPFRSSLNVPNDPRLRGARLFAQGVELDPSGTARLMGTWQISLN